MTANSLYVVLCNGASLPKGLGVARERVLPLEYRPTIATQNINLQLPNFVRDVYHLPNRILDLLEIASYIFSADRLKLRGHKDDLEYQSWPRSFHFVIKVRDHEFWQTTNVMNTLRAALTFMTGDSEYDFTFQAGHSTPKTSLFDDEEFRMDLSNDKRVTLFSGGLDSLTGVIDSLETSTCRACLVSHQSQPGTIRTQDQLFETLRKGYPGRVAHYKFKCTLKAERAIEETQRTRAFLYSAIAFSLCKAFALDRFFVYENGMTAINFPRRQDMMNARASRTTHPKTIALLEQFYSLLHEGPFTIETPYLWRTKADVFLRIKELGKEDLISSSVSCSRTFQRMGLATHCGSCSQCIDRRFGAYGSELDDADENGIYASDFVAREVKDGEAKTILVDYVRQAKNFAEYNIDHFYKELINELADLEDFLPGVRGKDAIQKIWELCRKHGQQIENAIGRMRINHDKIYDRVTEGSFLHMVSQREYLKEPIQRLVDDICKRLVISIPIAFQKNQPKDEPDFNDKVSAILNSGRERFEREHPSISFAMAHAQPDHSTSDSALLIESKYIRGSTSPSKATDGIAADITKYPLSSHILFIVYDPMRSITDERRFKEQFEATGRCTIQIIR